MSISDNLNFPLSFLHPISWKSASDPQVQTLALRWRELERERKSDQTNFCSSNVCRLYVLRLIFIQYSSIDCCFIKYFCVFFPSLRFGYSLIYKTVDSSISWICFPHQKKKRRKKIYNYIFVADDTVSLFRSRTLSHRFWLIIFEQATKAEQFDWHVDVSIEFINGFTLKHFVREYTRNRAEPFETSKTHQQHRTKQQKLFGILSRLRMTMKSF